LYYQKYSCNFSKKFLIILTAFPVYRAYALLPDETCWFLAADFDKKTWKDDVLQNNIVFLRRKI